MLITKIRSTKFELLDEVETLIATHDLHKNLQELDFINTYLGGHAITAKGLKPFVQANNNTVIYILEIGCGGGDNLKYLANYCRQKNINAKFIGLDLKPDCIAYAKANNSDTNIEYLQSAYEDFIETQKIDIIFSSLFCHHFTATQIIEQLKWMQQNAKLGFFINDLQRNILAYTSIKFLTKIFSKSYLVKHDAPLSVLRAYTKTEWQSFLLQALLPISTIQWKWAFRFLIIYKQN